jgi:hypothetical protein
MLRRVDSVGRIEDIVNGHAINSPTLEPEDGGEIQDSGTEQAAVEVTP